MWTSCAAYCVLVMMGRSHVVIAGAGYLTVAALAPGAMGHLAPPHTPEARAHLTDLMGDFQSTVAFQLRSERPSVATLTGIPTSAVGPVRAAVPTVTNNGTGSAAKPPGWLATGGAKRHGRAGQ